MIATLVRALQSPGSGIGTAPEMQDTCGAVLPIRCTMSATALVIHECTLEKQGRTVGVRNTPVLEPAHWGKLAGRLWDSGRFSRAVPIA